MSFLISFFRWLERYCLIICSSVPVLGIVIYHNRIKSSIVVQSLKNTGL